MPIERRHAIDFSDAELLRLESSLRTYAAVLRIQTDASHAVDTATMVKELTGLSLRIQEHRRCVCPMMMVA